MVRRARERRWREIRQRAHFEIRKHIFIQNLIPTNDENAVHFFYILYNSVDHFFLFFPPTHSTTPSCYKFLRDSPFGVANSDDT